MKGLIIILPQSLIPVGYLPHSWGSGRSSGQEETPSS